MPVVFDQTKRLDTDRPGLLKPHYTGIEQVVSQKRDVKSNSKKKKFLIYTRYRSGSSFVGELFNHHPDNYYMFEPLKLLSLQHKVGMFLY